MKKLVISFAFGFVAALLLAGVALATVQSINSQPRQLSRAEVAPLLVRVYVAATGEVPPVPDCPFIDIADLPRDQHDSICQLWGLGVVVGTERDKLYSPELPFATWADVYLNNLAMAVMNR